MRSVPNAVSRCNAVTSMVAQIFDDAAPTPDELPSRIAEPHAADRPVEAPYAKAGIGRLPGTARRWHAEFKCCRADRPRARNGNAALSPSIQRFPLYRFCHPLMSIFAFIMASVEVGLCVTRCWSLWHQMKEGPDERPHTDQRLLRCTGAAGCRSPHRGLGSRYRCSRHRTRSSGF